MYVQYVSLHCVLENGLGRLDLVFSSEEASSPSAAQPLIPTLGAQTGPRNGAASLSLAGQGAIHALPRASCIPWSRRSAILENVTWRDPALHQPVDSKNS